MIRYGLRCPAGHEFDGWFRSIEEFDRQSGRRLIACPDCGAVEVAKALMAPAVASLGRQGAMPLETNAAAAAETRDYDVALVDERQTRLRQMLRDLRTEMTRNSEDVGDRFATVARQMHAEEIAHRTIHGRATAEDVEKLVEDGVSLQALPVFPDDLN